AVRFLTLGVIIADISERQCDRLGAEQPHWGAGSRGISLAGTRVGLMTALVRLLGATGFLSARARAITALTIACVPLAAHGTTFVVAEPAKLLAASDAVVV